MFDDAHYRTAGVYMIRSRRTGKAYIGSSYRIEHRWKEHVAALRRGQHHSKSLQEEWRRSSNPRVDFEFQVIEAIEFSDDPEDVRARLQELEQLYIDIAESYLDGYNESPFANRPRPLTEDEWTTIKNSRLCFPITEVSRDRQKERSFGALVRKIKRRRLGIIEWLFGERFEILDDRSRYQIEWDTADRILEVVTDAGDTIVQLFGHVGDPYRYRGGVPTRFEMKFRIGHPDRGILNEHFLSEEQARRWLRRSKR